MTWMPATDPPHPLGWRCPTKPDQRGPSEWAILTRTYPLEDVAMVMVIKINWIKIAEQQKVTQAVGRDPKKTFAWSIVYVNIYLWRGEGTMDDPQSSAQAGEFSVYVGHEWGEPDGALIGSKTRVCDIISFWRGMHSLSSMKLLKPEAASLLLIQQSTAFMRISLNCFAKNGWIMGMIQRWSRNDVLPPTTL